MSASGFLTMLSTISSTTSSTRAISTGCPAHTSEASLAQHLRGTVEGGARRGNLLLDGARVRVDGDGHRGRQEGARAARSAAASRDRPAAPSPGAAKNARNESIIPPSRPAAAALRLAGRHLHRARRCTAGGDFRRPSPWATGLRTPSRARPRAVSTGLRNSSPVERARSMTTNWQSRCSSVICGRPRSGSPAGRKGVSIHGRSRSATNMPTLRSLTSTFDSMG